jgi:putative cell wall-binding protein
MQVYAIWVEDPVSVSRVGGADRFAVSASISRGLFSEQVSRPLYASAAAAVSSPIGAPVLLVAKDALPGEVALELTRYQPNGIIFVGGPAAISEPVVDEIRARSSTAVTRISGADRFAASAATSAFAFNESVPVAYVASGENYPDALVGGAVAGRAGGPVLLTKKDELPQVIADELARLKPAKIVVLGGTAAVSEATKAKLNAIAPTTRVSGADRYASAANASKSTFAEQTRVVYVASGENFPDALSSGAAAAANRGPVLLVKKDGIPAEIAAELRRLDPRKIVLVGGPAAVSDSVFNQLEGFLRKE